MLLILLILAIAAPSEAWALPVSIDIPESSMLSKNIVQIVGLVTVLGLAPSLLITFTSFTRIVIVLSLIRTGIGVQQTPPNIVITTMALFITLFVMSPTLDEAYSSGVKPFIENKIDEIKAIKKASLPFRKFMLSQVSAEDIHELQNLSKNKEKFSLENTPISILLPAFMLSEIKRAFEIGFLVFLPFLVIDMLVSSILMSMGMMMLPPTAISLPFKLIFFVLIDGWNLVFKSLVNSFNL